MPRNRPGPDNYFYLLLGLVVWIWYRIWVVGSSGPEHFFLNLRLSSNGLEGFEPLGTVGRFYPLIFALFTFEHIYTHKRNRHLRIICWIWMMSYAIATMGKFAVLTPILAWSIIKGLQGRIRMGRIAAIVCGTFVLMLVVHFIRKGEQDEAGFLDVLATYVYSPIVALGYVKPVVSEYTAPYVFRFFYAMGNFFGLSPAPIDVISDYVYIPFPTNVYTVMQPFLHDFSLIGVAVGALFYAFLFCILFWLAVMNKGYYLGLYAMISICLVGQFFAETLLMMLSQHIQEAIMLAFIFIVSRRRFDVG
ncbi:O-antigen polymerase [Tepidiphilus thermophilus]|uniref:O-antigen polymerase n=1 Tax=Tepidiphilus thermophilus TaxID=876478 RepID=UPI001E5D82BF|nr:O-antigen polymerase [Tepidiphilus thermophilus]